MSLSPHPEIARLARLVSRTHEIIIDRDRWTTVAALDEAPLAALLPKTDRLPGVISTEVLTAGAFFAPGSRRRVHLSDGSTALEEVLERHGEESFRYVVWKYTSKAAAAIMVEERCPGTFPLCASSTQALARSRRPRRA